MAACGWRQTNFSKTRSPIFVQADTGSADVLVRNERSEWVCATASRCGRGRPRSQYLLEQFLLSR